MSKRIIKLTERDLTQIIKRVLTEQSLPTDKSYYIFSDAAKKFPLTPGPNKFVKAIPKASYFQIIMNPKPGNGILLYDCSGTLKLDKGGNMGYQSTTTIVYNNTIVEKLNKSKYCSGGSYVNPDTYTLNNPSDVNQTLS
jgi:hypothetical protein